MRKKVIYEIPRGASKAQCRGCGYVIYWIKTPAGKNMPVDSDGQPHWATCPKRDVFKRWKRMKEKK